MITDEVREELNQKLAELVEEEKEPPKFLVFDQKGGMLEHFIVPMILCEGAGFGVPHYPGMHFFIEEIEKFERFGTTVLHVRGEKQLDPFLASCSFLDPDETE